MKSLLLNKSQWLLCHGINTHALEMRMQSQKIEGLRIKLYAHVHESVDGWGVEQEKPRAFGAR
eukprot:1066111-Pelagomonas_calceolata.AAC.1